MKGYIFRLLIAIDQLLNALLGGRPDHTVSGRVGFHASAGKAWALRCEKVINAMFFWQPDHCSRAIEWDETKQPLDEAH